MKHIILSIYWSIISVITTGIIASGVASAHPGHLIEEELHGYLHGINLLVLITAIVLVIVIKRFIKKIP